MAIWALVAADSDPDDAAGPAQFSWPGLKDAVASPLDATAALLVTLAAWPPAPSAPAAVANSGTERTGAAATSEGLLSPSLAACTPRPGLPCASQFAFLNGVLRYLLANFGFVGRLRLHR